MSLSDCEKCWETPCVCGHNYEKRGVKKRFEIAEAALGMPLNQALKEMLKENLEVEVNTKTERDFGSTYQKVEVSVMFDGEVISKSEDSLE